jgi:hypothetical protein
MATCQSWRPQAHTKHPVPLAPGSCRGCWTVCVNLVPAGTKRCAECLELLITSSNPEIRRAVALEPGASEATLVRLSEDNDYSVALTADNILDTRGRSVNKPLIPYNPLARSNTPFGAAPSTGAVLPWATK